MKKSSRLANKEFLGYNKILNEKQRELISEAFPQVQKLVGFLAKKYRLSNNYDVLYDAAIGEVFRKIHTFDPTSKYSFYQTIKYPLIRRIFQYYNKYIYNIKEYSNIDSITEYTDSKIHNEINEFLEPLEENEKKLIQLYYIHGYYYQEIAKMYKCCPKRLQYKITKITQKLRDYYAISCNNSEM